MFALLLETYLKMLKSAAWLVVICGIVRSTDLYFRNPLIATGELSVLQIITWEHLINLLIVSIILISYRKSFYSINKKDFLLMSLVGAGASVMGILCFTQSFHYINPAISVLLQKLQPIMAIVLSCIVLKESITFKTVVYAAIAIICSYFVSFSFNNPLTETGSNIAKGTAWAIGASFFWGSGTVWGKILLKKYDEMFVMSTRFLFGSVFAVAILLYSQEGFAFELLSENNYERMYYITYMALISGLIASTFYYYGLKRVKASRATILEMTFPISSATIMWLSFERPLDSVQIVAAITFFYIVSKICKQQDKANV